VVVVARRGNLRLNFPSLASDPLVLVLSHTHATTHPPRPRSESEVSNDTPEVVQCNELHKEVQLTQSVNKKEYARKYHFDKVYDADTSQERLYETAVAPMVDEVLQGFNCTVFAYGQTGTGKTHTMTGGEEGEAGVIPRAVGHIFKYLNGLGGVNEFTVKCSFLELYNEEITDLLASEAEGSPAAKKVRIMEDPRAGVVMQGLEEPIVKTAGDIYALLDTGNARRRTAETLLNKQSSRSHSVFIVTVSVREVLAEGEEVIRVGKLYLVDLAGSENITRSGADRVDQRAKEAGNINKSLLTLGRVITALVEGQGHVPYRDSKLTRLLRDSLGGRTKTCIIATIAPTVQCQEETMSTLEYAHRAKNIKNKPEVNQKISKTTHLKEMGGEIARLKAELVAAREKHGVYMPHAQYEEDQARLKDQGARIEAMEAEKEQLEAELGMTRAELEAAQQDIAEGHFVIEACRRCEERLAGHAMGLTKDLRGALKDVTTLFARVDAKEGLEAANVALLGDLAERVGGQVEAMGAALRAAVGSQMELLGDARSGMGELSSLQKRARGDVEAAVGDAKAKVDGMVEALQGALGALAASGSASLEGVEGAVSAFQATADDAAKAAVAALDKAMGELREHGDAEAAALRALRSKQEEHGNAMRLAVAGFVGELQAAMTDITGEVSRMATTLERALASHKADVAGFKAGHQASVDTGKEELVRALTSLVSKFAADQLAAVDGFCEDRLEKMEADGASVTKNMKAVNGASETAANALTAHQSALTAVQDEADRDATGAHAAVEEHGASVMASAVAVHEGASAFVKDSRGALKQFAKNVGTRVGKDLEALDAARAGHCDEAAASGQVARVDLDRVDRAVAGAEAAQGQVVDRLARAAEAGEENLTSFGDEHKAGLEALGAAVAKANDDFAMDEERDRVPSREGGVEVPSEEGVEALRAPSVEALCRRFRGGEEVDGLEEEDVARSMEAIEAKEKESDGPDAGIQGHVEERVEEENVVPNAEQDAVDLDDSNVTTSRKRGRSTRQAPEGESPPKRERGTKLKAAFEAGETRRTTRRTSSRHI